MKSRLETFVLSFWHRKTWLCYALAPLSWIFQSLSWLRYHYLLWKGPYRANKPVIIVGNISVGGTGKTPLVAALAQTLQSKGFHPAIIMHGYGSNLKKGEVVCVSSNLLAQNIGDEALFMARKCKDMVVVASRSRVNALKLIEKQFEQVDVIICDDGLQHYAIERDIEIAVLDAKRRFGNGFCLPIGPLRESPRRLKRVDFIVAKGEAKGDEWSMHTQLQDHIYSLHDKNESATLAQFRAKVVHAVAGIGHPKRFFDMLRQAGIEVIEHPFADHHAFALKDFDFKDEYPIFMTEKDAVKCGQFPIPNAYVVPLTVKLEDKFLDKLLRRLQDGQKALRHSRLSHLQATPRL